MSGHGGSGPSSEPIVNCETLSGSTRLNSPQKEIVDQIKIGDILSLQINGAFIEAYYNEDLAGSITWAHSSKMIQCISEGHSYIAIVKQIDGGSVLLEIRPQ